MSANYTIYKGRVWKEYTSNKLLLTLDAGAAGALEAAIPLWVSLVGPLSWILIQYCWFRISVLRGIRVQQTLPFYYRQKQVLLHNSAGDLSTVADSFRLFWAWRKKQGYQKSCWKTAPLLIIALLFWSGWQATAIVSSYIWQTKEPTVGLVRSGTCGYSIPEGPGADLATRQSGISVTIAAETYVTQCYGTGSTGACDVYAKQALNYNSSDTTCPFPSPDICISTNSTPYRLDTGPLDSHSDLGINAPPKDRVTYQKINVCSPIHSTRFAMVVNANETDEAYYWPPDTQLQQFYFGPIYETNFSYTFEYSDWAPLDGFGYDIQCIMYNPGPPGTLNAWSINKTFTDRTDADISILFFTPNSVAYNSSVYDPFFIANSSYDFTVGEDTYVLYAPTYNVNTMGCIEQHRLCNPTVPDLCTPYTAYLNFQSIPGLLTSLNFNPTQLATAERIVSGLLSTLTFNSVINRGAAALLASQTVSDLLQTNNLPIDQWRIEVENWFAVSLAKLQQGILEFAAGPSNPALIPYVQPPTDTDTKNLCYNQLVQLPPGYVNFDFEAILIVTLLGFFIFVMAMCFEWVAEKCIKKLDRGRGLTEWREDGQFQLLKKMYEAEGVGSWENPDGDMPVTTEGLRHGGMASGATAPPVAGTAGSAHGSSHPLVTLHPGNAGQGNLVSVSGTSVAGPGSGNASTLNTGAGSPGSGNVLSANAVSTHVSSGNTSSGSAVASTSITT